MNISVGGASIYFATSLDIQSNFPADVKNAFTQASSAINQGQADGIHGRDEDAIEEQGDNVGFYDIKANAKADFCVAFETVRESGLTTIGRPDDAETLVNAFQEYLNEETSKLLGRTLSIEAGLHSVLRSLNPSYILIPGCCFARLSW